MLRRCALHVATAVAVMVLPIAAARDGGRPRTPPQSPHSYKYFDPQVIAPECRYAVDPLDCSAEAGARELEAASTRDDDVDAEAGGPTVASLSVLANPGFAAVAMRHVERGFNTRQLLEFGARQSEAVTKIAATRITVHRLAIKWWDVQCEGPDSWKFDAYVELVQKLNAENVHVILTPVGSPNWARVKTRQSPVEPTDPCKLTKDKNGNDRLLAPYAHGDNLAAWITFIQHLAMTFQPLNVVGYEIWNEENSRNFWDATGYVAPKGQAAPPPQSPNPGQWALLYCRAAGQIDVYDRAKPVGVGGLAVYQANQRDKKHRITNVKSSAFLASAYTAQRSRCKGKPFDFVGYHPYMYTSVAGGTIADIGSTPAARELTAIRRVMRTKKNGQTATPVWNTEWGFPSGFLRITLEQQAALIEQEHNYLANLKDKGGFFMQYSIMFNPVDGSSGNVFEHMGVLTPALEPKEPTYSKWSSLP